MGIVRCAGCVKYWVNNRGGQLLIDDEAKLIKAENYLKHVRSLAILVESTQEQIEYQKGFALSAVNYGDKVTVQPTRDAVDNCVIKLQDLISEFCQDMAEYVEAQHEASRCLACLEKPEHKVALTKYYLCGKSWEQVCVEMGYSWGGMMKLRHRAIIETYEYIPEYWKSVVVPDAEPDE